MGMFDIGRSLPAIPAIHRQTIPLARRRPRDPHRQDHPDQRPQSPPDPQDPDDDQPHIDEYA